MRLLHIVTCRQRHRATGTIRHRHMVRPQPMGHMRDPVRRRTLPTHPPMATLNPMEAVMEGPRRRSSHGEVLVDPRPMVEAPRHMVGHRPMVEDPRPMGDHRLMGAPRPMVEPPSPMAVMTGQATAGHHQLRVTPLLPKVESARNILFSLLWRTV